MGLPGQLNKRVHFSQNEMTDASYSHRGNPDQLQNLYQMRHSGVGREPPNMESVSKDPRPLHGVVPVMTIVEPASYKKLVTPGPLVEMFHDIANAGYMDPNFVYINNTDNFGRTAYPISATQVSTTGTSETLFLKHPANSKGYNLSSSMAITILIGVFLVVGLGGQFAAEAVN